MVPNTGSLPAAVVVELLRAGQAPAGLKHDATIEITGPLRGPLPTGLEVPALLLRKSTIDALPDGLRARRIVVANNPALIRLGTSIICRTLDIPGSGIETLPDDLVASDRIDLSNCQRLRRLPANLKTGSLRLNDCTALTELPSGLDVAFLDLSGCTSLRRLPADLRIRGGRLSIRNCPWLTRLPDGLGEISELDVAGCLNLASLPEGLVATSWIDIAGSAITALPPAMREVGLRWRGIPVSHRVVFEPETLDPKSILTERNAELRRVMIERVGYERLLAATQAEELDRDRDAGGERRLLLIPLEGDEPVVVVSVQCPSTGHRFILRVPPAMRTCHEAVAWTAGYDDPAAYRPMRET